MYSAGDSCKSNRNANEAFANCETGTLMLNWVIGKRSGRRPRSVRRKPSYEEAKRIAVSPDARARTDLASVEYLEPEFLYYLASDESPAVRRSVATNESTPLQADRILAHDADEEVRCELARKIGRLVPSLTPDETDHLTEMAMEVLEVLARDDLPRVRATIAEEIKRADNAPPSVVNRLARDIEEIVSAPVLEYSPLLSDADLLDIIAGGCASGVLAALARRHGLSEKVSAALAETRDVNAVASLLGNKSAQISEEVLDLIAVHSENVVEWHAPMVNRETLPARVVRRIATFVSAALLDTLIERHRDQADLVDTLRKTVRKRIEQGDLVGADENWEPAEERARLAYEQGQLNEQSVLDALKEGDKAFVRYALVHLSGLDFTTVSRLLNANSAKAATAVAWKAGLSMDAAEALQLQVARIRPSQALRATPDGRYPIRQDDLTWYLECVTT